MFGLDHTFSSCQQSAFAYVATNVISRGCQQSSEWLAQIKRGSANSFLDAGSNSRRGDETNNRAFQITSVFGAVSNRISSCQETTAVQSPLLCAENSCSRNRASFERKLGAFQRTHFVDAEINRIRVCELPFLKPPAKKATNAVVDESILSTSAREHCPRTRTA